MCAAREKIHELASRYVSDELAAHRREYFDLAKTWDPKDFNATALARRAIAALRRVGTGAGVEGRALEVAEEVARWAELAWDR